MTTYEQPRKAMENLEEGFVNLGNPNDLMNEYLNSQIAKKAVLALGGIDMARSYIQSHGTTDFEMEFASEVEESSCSTLHCRLSHEDVMV